MESKRDGKRRKDKQSDSEEHRREKSRRQRSRSRSRSQDPDRDSRRKRRRHSKSRSPNVPVKHERTRRDEAPNDVPNKADAPERKKKETDMLNTRTGGAYIPPARLRMMQAQITDKSSVAYQRLAWEALKKSIHGHINKINVGNIGIIIKELLKENIVRGRGLLCRSVIQAQAASPTFTNVYAALVAAVNSRFPNIGELLLKRLVIQFKRGFKRNDKPTCISAASFVAHLVNQRVAHEILALELLTLLVETPTDDSVEVAIAFLKECGQKLTEVSSKGVNAIFEMLRNILHEGQLDKRVQYMIEVMFQVWKDGFKDHPALIEELELVPEEEQFTHLLMLDDATDPQDILNVFKHDEKYEENEQKYKTLCKEILGSDAESGEEDGSGESGSDESDDDEEEQEGEQKGMTIIDNTETNLVALRRTIYLTINSSLDFEECAHKLMKMQLKPGQEIELCHMFLDCCAEQRTYEKFYGLLAQRFCNINKMYISPFEEIFKDSYGTAHRLDTNRLRNVSKFFAHLLFTDSISWEVLECVKLNEEDTTSSSRIYIKILFQELAEYMGLKKLNDRLKDPTLQEAFAGIFPRDNPKNTRFSINFFTSIGLGGLTDELREHLKQMPKNVPAAVTDINVDSDSSSGSSSSSSSSDSSSDSSSSDSDAEEDKTKKKSKKSKENDKSKSAEEEKTEGDSTRQKNDRSERWGHDGFYDNYGQGAQRFENRHDKSERNKDNYAREKDGLRGNDDRERQRYMSDERRYRDDRSNRDSGRRQENTQDTDEHRTRKQDKERYDVRRKENGENVRNNLDSRDRDEIGRKGRSDKNERRRENEDGVRNDRDNRDRSELGRKDRNEKDERRRGSGEYRNEHDKERDERERKERSEKDDRKKQDDKRRERSDRDDKRREDGGSFRNNRDIRDRDEIGRKTRNDKDSKRGENIDITRNDRDNRDRDDKGRRDRGDREERRRDSNHSDFRSNDRGNDRRRDKEQRNESDESFRRRSSRDEDRNLSNRNGEEFFNKRRNSGDNRSKNLRDKEEDKKIDKNGDSYKKSTRVRKDNTDGRKDDEDKYRRGNDKNSSSKEKNNDNYNEDEYKTRDKEGKNKDDKYAEESRDDERKTKEKKKDKKEAELGKHKDKDNSQQKVAEDSAHDDQCNETNKLGSRYWNTFDI